MSLKILKILKVLHITGANKTHVKSSRKLRKIRFLTKFVNYLINNLIGFTIVLFTLAYLFSAGTEKFFFLQHKDPKSGLYKKGKDDVYFIFTWTIILTFLRSAITKYIFIPLAKLGGVKNVQQKDFAEQGWLFLYYLISWTLGMYTMSKSPHWFDTTHLWIGYPHIEMPNHFKLYYLLQLAFCFQQIIVINIEKKNDYIEMFLHHLIAALFTGCTYLMNFTRVGNAILCTMDLSDIILPIFKMSRYCGFTTISNIIFGLFTFAWVVTRHGISWYIIYSSWFESTQFLEFKWVPEEGYLFTKNVVIGYLVLFLSLQVLIHFWSYLIYRILSRIIMGDRARRDNVANVANVHDDNKNENKSDSEWEEF